MMGFPIYYWKALPEAQQLNNVSLSVILIIWLFIAIFYCLIRIIDWSASRSTKTQAARWALTFLAGIILVWIFGGYLVLTVIAAVSLVVGITTLLYTLVYHALGKY